MQTWKRISARSFQTLCVLLAGMPSAEAIRLVGIEHRHRLAYRSINTALCAPSPLWEGLARGISKAAGSYELRIDTDHSPSICSSRLGNRMHPDTASAALH